MGVDAAEFHRKWFDGALRHVVPRDSPTDPLVGGYNPPRYQRL